MSLPTPILFFSPDNAGAYIAHTGINSQIPACLPYAEVTVIWKGSLLSAVLKLVLRLK
jgi:hypothetical protein